MKSSAAVRSIGKEVEQLRAACRIFFGELIVDKR